MNMHKHANFVNSRTLFSLNRLRWQNALIYQNIMETLKE